MDYESGRWVRVPGSQAKKKVLEIMQDVVSKSAAAFSRQDTAASATSLLNQNFLEEYVSKQTAVMRAESTKRRRVTAVNAGVASEAEAEAEAQSKAATARQTGTLPPSLPQRLRDQQRQHNHQRQYQQQIPQEYLQLQAFLGTMAASIPDIVVGNPFEPDPIPHEAFHLEPEPIPGSGALRQQPS